MQKKEFTQWNSVESEFHPERICPNDIPEDADYETTSDYITDWVAKSLHLTCF